MAADKHICAICHKEMTEEEWSRRCHLYLDSGRFKTMPHHLECCHPEGRDGPLIKEIAMFDELMKWMTD